MKKAFVALVGVYMLAEMVDSEKLRKVRDSLPRFGHWREVHEIIDREMIRREKPRQARAAGRPGRLSRDAA